MHVLEKELYPVVPGKKSHNGRGTVGRCAHRACRRLSGLPPLRLLAALLFAWCVAGSAALAEPVGAVPAGGGVAPVPAGAAVRPGARDTRQPMFGTRDGVWGRVVMSYRLRPEFRTNADLDAGTDDASLIGYQRARVGVAMHYANWFQGFVQFQDARAMGEGNATNAYLANSELHQAWVRFSGPGGSAVTLGKQQLVYGNQRLIGHLEWANKPRTYDAAKVRWQRARGWVDLFGAVFTPDGKGNILDGTVLSGAYHHLSLAGGDVVWEQYLLGLSDAEGALPPGQTYDTLEGDPPVFQRRIGTLGTRFLLKRNGFKTEFEGGFQGGTADVAAGVAHRAWYAHLDLGYTTGARWKPSVRAEVNYGSGDDASTSNVVERFNNLFPTNHMHYGYMDLQNLSNNTSASIGFGVAPRKRLIFQVDYWLHGRATIDDGWYNAGGGLLADADPDSTAAEQESKLIGHEVDVTVKVPVRPNVKLVWGGSVFQPAGFGTTRGSDAQFWSYTMLLAKF